MRVSARFEPVDDPDASGQTVRVVGSAPSDRRVTDGCWTCARAAVVGVAESDLGEVGGGRHAIELAAQAV